MARAAYWEAELRLRWRRQQSREGNWGGAEAAPPSSQRWADALAREQIKKYNPISVEPDTEYGGLIYELPDGTFGATPPQTAPCLGGASCQLDLGAAAEAVPDEAAIVLDWHTHGAAPPTNPLRCERFSRNDVLTTNQLGSAYGSFRGSYLGTPQGRLYFLPPGAIRASQWSERAIRQVQQYRGRVPR